MISIKRLNLEVDTPPLAATAVVAALLQLYQVDLVHQPWDLRQLRRSCDLYEPRKSYDVRLFRTTSCFKQNVNGMLI